MLREGSTDLYFGSFDVPASGIVRRDLRLTGTGVITGRVTSAREMRSLFAGLRRESDGKNVAHVFFSLGGDGAFRIPHLDSGDYLLIVGAPKVGFLKRWIAVTGREVNLGDLTIERTPETPVVVTAPAGVKVAGEFSVQARSQDGAAYAWLALDDDGRGHLGGLRPGRYVATLKVPGCVPLQVEIEIEDAPAHPLAFTLLRE